MIQKIPTITDLKNERAKIVKKLQDLHSLAESENRNFTSEEQETWDHDTQAVEHIEQRINRAEQLRANTQYTVPDDILEDESRSRFDSRRKSSNPRDEDPERPLTAHERNCALRFWAMGAGNQWEEKEFDAECFRRLHGIKPGESLHDKLTQKRFTVRLDRPDNQAPRSLAEVREQSRQRREEQRAVNQVGTDNLGGYTAPDEMMRPLEEALLAFGGMRLVSNIISTSTGNELPIPTENDTSQTGELIANETTAVGEQALTFGQLVLNAYTYSSKMIPVSWLLMQDSATNLPALIGRRAGERIGRLANAHFTTGTGSAQPKGIVTAATSSGVTTSGAAAIAYDDLVDLEHSVDIAYRTGASWMMHDTSVKILKKLKETTGLPIWVPAMTAGEPGTILGYPFVVNNSMPTGTASKAVIFGQLSKYIIREVRDVTLVRLDERYAEYLRTGFFAYARLDGDLLDAGTNPVKYLTMG